MTSQKGIAYKSFREVLLLENFEVKYVYYTNCAVGNKNKGVKNNIKLKYPLLSQRMRGRGG
jgi:thioredoxin-related protein